MPFHDTSVPRVLLLDDDLDTRELTAEVLTDAGFAVTSLADADEALVILGGADGLRFQALVTDHLMPGMTGSELVTQLATSHPHLPCIVISGLDTGLLTSRTRQLLGKPFRSIDLTDAVHRLLKQC